MNRRGTIIAGYVALSAAMGLLEAYLRAHTIDLRVVTVASLFPFAVLLFMWCKADSAQRGIDPPAGATLLVAFVAIIGVPYYYFRILTPLKALGHVLCAYLVLGLGMGITVLADGIVWRLLGV